MSVGPGKRRAKSLEEPQEALDRSQLHSFKKQMFSQRQQAAHNATQDHIRLRTEPFLYLQRQAARNTEYNKLGITLVNAAMPADIPSSSRAESETGKIAAITAPTLDAGATVLSYKLGALVVT